MATAETRLASRSSRVLVASSNESFRRLWAERPEYETADLEQAAGGADAIAKLESEDWGEVLLDRHLHDLDVNEVLQIIRCRRPHLLVRVVDLNSPSPDDGEPSRAHSGPIGAPPESPADCEIGLESPDDAFSPPCEPPAPEIRAAHLRVEPLPGMMGDGPGLEQIYRLARLVSSRQTTVLITGETGTG